MTAVVLVSGWAMSGEVLAPLAEGLRAKGCDVSCLSLADAEDESWESLLQMLDSHICSRRVVLAGWSLGGNLCARYAAQYPANVAGLVTMGSTPCFVSTADWPNGKHPEAYQVFAEGIAADMPVAMKGFAPVCVRGSHDLKRAIRTLRASAKQAMERTTHWRTLLDRLAEDARSEWKKVRCTAYHFLADQDPLAKPEIAQDLAMLLPTHKVRVLSGSHAIFLDHTETILKTIMAMDEERVL